MLAKIETEQKIAKLLLQIKAIKLQTEHPFIWACGWKSPIYCDSRMTLSYPPIRTYIRQQLTALIQEEFGSVALIAGVATAGISQGVLVAQELGLPFIYVRSTPKDHGAKNLIEGEYFEGQRVVLIEDVIATGRKSLKAVEVLRSAGCEIAGLVSIFSYGFDVAEENFKAAKCRFYSLCSYETLIEVAAENGFVDAEELKLLYQWRENPSVWETLIYDKF